jgi:hypothetical protein
LKASSLGGAACVSLRSHSNGGHQPHARQLPPERSPREHRPELPRSGPEAEISPVKAARRLVARPFATINAPYRTLPGAQVPPAIPRQSPRFRAARLTALPAWRQLRFPEGHPGPAPSRSKRRRSRYLPLKRRSRSNMAGNAVALEAAVPRSFSSCMSLACPAFIAGRSLKRATASRAPGRHPMPRPCSRHPLSTRFAAARGRVCPLGLPARLRSYPRHRPGLSVRGGPMRVDGATTSEPIHQMARGPTSPPMPKPRPRGRPASPPPWLQKCTDGPDQPVSFLRPTELASADALADEPLGRCRDAVVARGAEVLDH